MFKKNYKFIIGLFLGITISLGTVFASNFIADDISFSPSNKSWSVNNVKKALDDLYSSKGSLTLIKENLHFDISTGDSSRVDLSNYNNYKNFKSEDFLLVINSYAAASNSDQNYNTDKITFEKNYDSNTGILTITAPKICYNNGSLHLYFDLYLTK